jgi:protein-arginine kinase activator protein McsA
MNCKCNQNSVIESNDAILYEQNFLHEVKVNAYTWETLYKCKECNTFWEEIYKDGRFGGTPVLKKVSIDGVSEKWTEKVK